MKRQLLVVAEKAKGTLQNIGESHRIALLDEEVIQIRGYLRSLLQKSISLQKLDSCKEFWESGTSKGRALARSLAHIKRCEIVDEIGELLGIIESLPERHLHRVIDEIDQQIRECLTILLESRKKKQKIDPSQTDPVLNRWVSTDEIKREPSAQ